MMMAAQISGTTNQLAGDSINQLSTKKIDDMEKPVGDSAQPSPARRKPSARRQRAAGCALSNSLRADRRSGLAATRGRLSVSFSDQKGLSSAQIGDILSGCEDGDPNEPEKSMAELLGVDDEDEDEKKSVGFGMMSSTNKTTNSSTNRRMQLMTIQSQRAADFNFDPNDLLDSDDEGE